MTKQLLHLVERLDDSRVAVQQQVRAKPALAVLLFGVAWATLRYADFASGFVEFSRKRLLLAAAVPCLVAFMPSFHLFRLDLRPRAARVLLILVLTLLGNVLFLSRWRRGANLGDTVLFRGAVMNTASGAPLDTVQRCLIVRRPFLLLFVPMLWLAGSGAWLLVQALHSLAIALWASWIGRFVGSLLHWSFEFILTLGLFFATYTQHADFHDTPFAALATALCVTGALSAVPRLVVLGFVGALLTRETAPLIVAFVLAALPGHALPRRLRLILVVGGLLWFVGMAVLVRALGGPSGVRLDPCLSAVPPSAPCVKAAIATDFWAKAAYLSRLISFAPVAAVVPFALSGAVPEAGLAVLSRDNVMYSLSWHYYMMILSVLVPAGFWRIRHASPAVKLFLVRWTLAICLWQFFTTTRSNLF